MIPDDQWKLDYRTEKQEWIDYLKQIYPYFNHCEGHTVLEMAPFMGTHTQVIESHGAKNITLVELNHIGLAILNRTYPDHTIICDDVFNFLQTKRNFDVVVCCGLLYHLHSPLYLLELIANMVDPKYLYIETYVSDVPEFIEETDNEMGMRQLMPDYKSIGLSLLLTEDVLLTSVKNLGYEIIDQSGYLNKPNGPVKLWVFKKL